MRRLSPLADTYTKERSVPVCTATLEQLGFELARIPNIRLDLDDRPQKSPRACVIASDPPKVVHLITRAQGGMHDYAAFLHEAGHALHYALCDPGLPYAFRKISRDHALTEVYSYLIEAVGREPGWHAEHFGLSDEDASRNAEAAGFIEALLFRRYTAKLGYELDFWGRFADDGGSPGGYQERLEAAVGFRYPTENYLSDMDWGFYRPTTCAPGSAPRSCGTGCPPTWGRPGGAARRPGRSCASCSAKGRVRRARSLQRGSASSPTTRARSSMSSRRSPAPSAQTSLPRRSPQDPNGPGPFS